ncbi:sigma-54 dependent transcriptional regulator [Hahella sp. SMD15-11]|uniref:Sigma-54 dependent transcriptional regulator n=1 Tax=Thermohahella caldifontis TaxID=3142973 RepID=A0AB39UU68_9GAMM
MTPQDAPQGEVIFIDDDAPIRKAVQQTLMLEGWSTRTFGQPQEALRQINRDWRGVVVTDLSMPDMDGMAVLEAVAQTDGEIPVILVTGHGDISVAVEAMRRGAYDFIEKPFTNERLVDTVRRALEKRNMALEIRALRQELRLQNAPGPRLLGNSPAIRRLRRTLHAILDMPADVLLHGETGTGKDLIARYLHEHSQRREHNFVAINCGAVPENLIESELFGHEAGAFTGADKVRIGKFEHANGGTLFLDEIESMPLALQVRLLRVLEERQVERLGSNRLIPLDIRVIAATKADLRQLADEGRFRADLYYRLNTVSVDIPPLRERPEDIPLLFEHFSVIASARFQREMVPLSVPQMQRLLAHDWPGNVRELRNLAERYVLMGDEALNDLEGGAWPRSGDAQQTLPERVEWFEQSIIRDAMRRHRGVIKDVMVELGLPRKTLYDKLAKYGIRRQDFLAAPDDPAAPPGPG